MKDKKMYFNQSDQLVINLILLVPFNFGSSIHFIKTNFFDLPQEIVGMM